MAQLKDVYNYLADVFKPNVRDSVSEWVAKNLSLPPTASQAEPGPISFDGREYLRKILDDFTDPEIKEQVFVAPTRSGKTFILVCLLAYDICVRHSSILLIDQTLMKARNLIKKDVHPFIKYNTKTFGPLMPDNPDDFGQQIMRFKKGEITVYAAQNSDQLAGDSARSAFGNEVNRWKEEEGDKVDPANEARNRVKSYLDPSLYFSSTPTTEECQIWEMYKAGTQERYNLRCVSCNELAYYDISNVRYSYDERYKTNDEYNYEWIEKNTKLECKNCGKLMDERERLKAVKEGAYIQENPNPEPGKASYHVNGVAMPKVAKLGHLAIKFIKAKNSMIYKHKKEFFNNDMGEPVKEDLTDLSVEKLKYLCKDYARGELPDDWKPDVILMGVDVQTYGMPYIVRAFKFTGESYLIDHGIASTWETLRDVQTDYNARHLFIDINFEDRRIDALKAILKYRKVGWVGIEGFEQQKQLVVQRKGDPFMGQAGAGLKQNQILILKISNKDFKLEIYKRLQNKIRDWFTYTKNDEQLLDGQSLGKYMTELTNEKLRKRNGKTSFVKTGENHAFDCEVYCFAGFYVVSQTLTAKRKKKGVVKKG